VTSKDNAQECFVYITLPGETEFVTAGCLVLTPDRQGVPTGRFVYGRSYLARDNAVAIDPMELKLGGSTYRAFTPLSRRTMIGSSRPLTT
jgi:serine/threonine-protein kinase HipA